MGALSKRHLRRKLAGHPFLCLLLQDAWFRLGIVAFLILVIFLALFLPPIWTTSPSGFRPVVKVSGLDLAQAWSLKRTALRAAASGQFDGASYAWKAALAKSPADAELVRGVLKNHLTAGTQDARGRSAVSHARWLLKLTGTNWTDLELVGHVLNHTGQYELFIDLMDSEKEKTAFPRPLETVYLKALFHAGRVAAFANRRQRIVSMVAADDDLALYQWAFEAGWGNGAVRNHGWQMLQSALEDPRLRVTAARLMLSASSQRRDASQYGEALIRLREWQEQTLWDQIGFWRLLALEGRKEEAIRFAETEACRPSSANEVIALAQLFRSWALRDQMLRVYRKFAGEFDHAAEFWVAYANELIDARHWEELRQVALRIRLQPEAHDELAAFSYYLEGRAELGQDRHVHAQAAFARVGQSEFPHPRLGLRIADDFIVLGHVEMARSLLLRLEGSLTWSADFWSSLFRASEKLKDSGLMLRAARHVFQLRPDDPASAGNYAATLLIHRQSPDEAVRLSLRVLSQRPGLLTPRINHGAALLLNHRAEEAFALLKTIDPWALPETQRSLYHLDLFEACLSLRRYDEAWEASDLIDARHLYPPQISWLEAARRSLPPRLPRKWESEGSRRTQS